MGEIGENWGISVVYVGEFAHTLDREGRLALPARLREALGDELTRGLFLTCGAEPCIVAYTQERFAKLLAGLEGEAGVSKSAARAFKRALGGRTALAAADKQGRILIPEVLRRFADITREVVVVGAIDSVEIWDAKRYRLGGPSREVAYGRVAPRVLG